MAVRAEDAGRSERRPVIGWIGAAQAGIPWPERAQTSGWCPLAREQAELLEGGKANECNP